MTAESLASLSAAAVALLLTPDQEVLLIARAEAEGDPWSGHVALPGGRAEPEDADSAATAMRETWEEVGIALTRTQLVASLPAISPLMRHRIVVTPHVFAVPSRLPVVCSDEVAAAFWVPLSMIQEGRKSFILEHEGIRLRLPCVDVQGRRLWGLTLRILEVWSARA